MILNAAGERVVTCRYCGNPYPLLGVIDVTRIDMRFKQYACQECADRLNAQRGLLIPQPRPVRTNRGSTAELIKTLLFVAALAVTSIAVGSVIASCAEIL